MKKYFDYKTITIIILLILLFLSIINPNGILPNRVEFNTVIDSVPYPIRDTVPYEVLIEVPVEVEDEVEKSEKNIVTEKITQTVDTNEILKEYNSKKLFKEVLNLPNNLGTLTLFDSISRNVVINRKFETKIKKFTRDTIRILEPNKNQLYFGFNGQFDKANFVNGFGVSTLLKTKDDKIFRVGVGVNNRLINDNTGKLGPYIDGGIYWKIKIKK
jgi:hypothetical protein